MPFIRRKTLTEMLWKSRQEAIEECKSDVAHALQVEAATTSWTQLIEVIEIRTSMAERIRKGEWIVRSKER